MDSKRRGFVGWLAGAATATLLSPREAQSIAVSARPLRGNGYYINVKEHGALGDGVTDDFDAIMEAEDRAHRQGRALYFPKGVYRYRARLGFRVSALGSDETTLMPLDSVGSSNDTLSNIHPVTNERGKYITFENFTIDANLLTRGIYIGGGDRVTIRNCRVFNSIACGIGLYQTQNSLVEDCQIENVHYLGSGADGIYLGGSSGCTVVQNRIRDFRRIGIVTESDTIKSEDNAILRNRISYSHSSDDSPTEFNAGIWCENSNGAIIEGNVIWDMAGEDHNQSSGRVPSGIVIGLGTDRSSVFQIRNNSLDIGDGIPRGIGISAAGSGNSHILIEGNLVKNAKLGVSLSGVLESVTIENTVFDQIELATSSALVTIDADTIGELRVRNCTHSNVVFAAGDVTARHIHIFQLSNEISLLSLEGLESWSYSSRTSSSKLKTVVVSRCRLLLGEGDYAAFRAKETILDHCRIELMPGHSYVRNIFGQLGGVADRVQVSNCEFIGIDSEIFGDGETRISFDHCIFDAGSHLKTNWTGPGLTLEFRNSNFRNWTSNGAIRTNYTAVSGIQLVVVGCHFEGTGTPLRVWNFSPDTVILSLNVTTTQALQSGLLVTVDHGNYTL